MSSPLQPEGSPQAPPRRRYEKPRVHVYGTLGTLTQNVTNMGNMDGAKGKFHGTSPNGPPGWNM